VPNLPSHNSFVTDQRFVGILEQPFNSSEKRLVRMLLLLAHFGKDGKPEVAIPKVSQETLAEMVGTTRPTGTPSRGFAINSPLG
jgi:hypothetical protein